ncbi:MAG: hypothetical protein IT430_17120 [Phycisphaerales bacterium]|nr:hypothetical protein [Phycisphaerales bacterium]
MGSRAQLQPPQSPFAEAATRVCDLRRKHLHFCVVGIALLAVAVLLLNWRPVRMMRLILFGAFSTADFLQIEPGMNETDVRRLIGPPLYVTSMKDGSQLWEYWDGFTISEYTVIVKDGLVVSREIED